ncbi:MAG TPA: PepSY-like domain-containing protein, partial [Planctomycetaceae bacterium]|nr:PepSY-like domain-containing protein [Planctomycetaceae bacterium]
MSRFILMRACVVAGVICGGLAFGDIEDIPVNKLPKPVVDAVKAKFPKAKIEGASKAVTEGQTTYGVELTSDKTKYVVEAEEDGEIVEIDKEIPVKELPKKVSEAVKKKYAKAKLETADEILTIDEGKETKHFGVKISMG